MRNLNQYFESVPYNEDRVFGKNDLTHLPPCFKPAWLGNFRLGMVGQYRCKKLHAYDFGSYWEIHKDKWNPETHPLEHLVEDAPHWLFAGLGIAAGLGLAAWCLLTDNDE